MAKRITEPDGSADKGGMRILYVELNGSNSSLQEGLRTLVAAMNKPVQVAPAPRRLVANQKAEAEAEAELFNQTAEMAAVTETEQDEQPDAGSNGSARRPRGEGPKKDRNGGLSIVKSLNLRPEGKDSLKDFVAKKKPQSQIEHITVYVYYLKNVVEEPKVGFSHIFTCFRETGERMPGDLPQTCRNAASQKGWIDTADPNDLKCATHGDNLVNHDLPHTDGKGENEAK